MTYDKTFFCSRCGQRLETRKKTCQSCGFGFGTADPYKGQPALGAGGIGWSQRVNDPLFANYQKNSRRYMVIFATMLAVVVPVIMLATGDLQWDEEGKMVMGVIGGMYFLLAIIMCRNTMRKGREWLGVVEDKKCFQREKWGSRDSKGRRQKVRYSEYVVYVRLREGKLHELKYNDHTLYDYYSIGDHLHCHRKKNLRAVEKYDKSRDAILFCGACGRICDARADYCAACGCPLLKGQPEQGAPPLTDRGETNHVL